MKSTVFLSAFAGFALFQATSAFNLAINSTAAERLRYCQLNSFKCSNVCATKTRANVCDEKTLRWDCVCAETKMPVSYNSFEIEAMQCRGDLAECTTACLKTVSAENTACATSCNMKHRCGTDDSHQSVYFYYYSQKPGQTTLSNDGTTVLITAYSVLPISSLMSLFL